MHKLVCAPRVRYESLTELRSVCENLMAAYTDLTHRVLHQKIHERRQEQALAWTELDRLMLGIASFDEVTDNGLYLLLASTKCNGALYAHDVNARLARCINTHNRLFFHETTLQDEAELHESICAMLGRMLLTSNTSHYHMLYDENFKRCVAWDNAEWLVCPQHRAKEYTAAIVSAGALSILPVDIVLLIVDLVGL